MRAVLTVAGSDSSGGAGIQADIKTMIMHGVYAMSAITALTAQNTTGVTGVFDVSPDFLEKQMDAVFTDIFPHAVKVGMVQSSDLVDTIAAKLGEYHAKNIVVDPVMVSTSGSKLTTNDAIDAMKDRLFQLASVITPNIPEAEVLSEIKISSRDDMVASAKKIYKMFSCPVLCKGGHIDDSADDVLCDAAGIEWFRGEHIKNKNTHGTGCTLSSAIASNLANGLDLRMSIKRAKEYVTCALSDMLDLGHGCGPINHAVRIPVK